MSVKRIRFMLAWAALAAVLGSGLLWGDEIDPRFAVVELYTSEGCSSCPPGEAALARLRDWADDGDLPVHTIAWHVDYWDSLGWPDSYGSPAATERQRLYGRWLDSSLYTPQAIIDGRHIADYAGDARAVERLVRNQLKERRDVRLVARIEPGISPGVLRIEFSLDSRRGYVVEAVLVEEGLVTRPTAGENSGRELHHASTVRSHSQAAPMALAIDLSVPDSVNRDNAAVIVLVRRRGEPDVVAARRLAFPELVTGTVEGRLRVSDGSPAAGAVLQFCTDTLCIPAIADEEGVFALDGLLPGAYAVKTADGAERTVLVTTGRTSVLNLNIAANGTAQGRNP